MNSVNRVGLVVSDDVDYGLDLANALYKKGMSVTLYLSLTQILYHLYGGCVQRNQANSDMLIELLYKKSLVPEDCQVRLIHFPRMRNPRSLSVINDLRKKICNDGLDVVHILMGPGELWIAVLAILIRNLPIVSTLIIPVPNIGEKLPRKVLWGIAKILTIGSNLVIVNGTEQVGQVCNLYALPQKKVVYIPLIPRAIAAKWADTQVEEQQDSILFIGKAQPRKGLEYLVKAQPLITDRVPNAKIVLATHGDDLTRCLHFIKDESKFEIHADFLTAKEFAAYFQKASVVVLPYLSASTSGLLTTAYIFGKPVVSTNVGALSEYVQHGITGFLVPPADEKCLAEAIINILLDDKLRMEMGVRAKEWVIEEQLKVANQTKDSYETAKIHFTKGLVSL